MRSACQKCAPWRADDMLHAAYQTAPGASGKPHAGLQDLKSIRVFREMSAFGTNRITRAMPASHEQNVIQSG
jgi:hypothetical protein